jgi:hypothetical protein
MSEEYYLYNLFDQIKIGLSNYLSGQVGFISSLSQLPVWNIL